METLCRLGEAKKAEEWLRQGAGLAETKWHLATAHGYLFEMYLNSGNQERAKAHLEAAIEFCRETDDPSGAYYIYERARHLLRVGIFLDEALEFAQKAVQLNSNVYTINTLGWAYLQKGDSEKTIECCKKALEVGMSNSALVARTLGLLEEAFAKAGKREEFISYCKELREKKAEEVQNLKLTQWYLEPKELSGLFTQITFEDEFDEPALKSEWEWVNPKGDSSYSLSSEVSWLEMRAASRSDLPRLLQEISGDFAVEIKMKAASDDLPSVGGLLIWKDEKNYIQFERGRDGKDEFGLSGSVGGEFEHFGRGLLASEVVYLRLERIGDRISAYCSGDGANPAERDAENRDWLTCGEVSFPVEAPIQVGIHAIARSTYGRGEATATRFDSFKIFR
jgi:regulation of enolase protein 1 (concanavalin A-like superfamily)